MQGSETMRACAHSVEVLVGVRIVKCHAIVDVLCHAVIRVVIGVHVLLLPPLIVAHFVSQFSYCISSSNSIPQPFFSYVFHCILTAFKVWYLQLRNLLPCSVICLSKVVASPALVALRLSLGWLCSGCRSPQSWLS